MRPRSWLILLTVAAGALRFATLGVQSFWSDEGFTVAIVGHTFGGILGAVRHTESTPPLYYSLAWVWHQLFGSSEVGLRSFSALTGTLAVPAAYAAAAEFFSRRVGLVCAALVAFNPTLVWYAQEARAYSLLLLLSLLGLWCFARALHGERGALVPWGALSALALATHYFAAFTIVPEAVWLLARRPRDARTWGAVAIPAAVGVALLPLLAFQNAHVARPWTAGYTIPHAISGVTQQALVGPTWTPFIHHAGTAALGLLVIAALVLLARDPERRRAAIVPCGLLVALIGLPLLVAVVGTNYVVIRNVIVAIPLGLMLVAAGCVSAPRGAAGLWLAGAICAIGLAITIAVPLTPDLQRADWRGTIRALTTSPGARVWVFLDRFDSTPISEVYLPDGRPLGATPVAVRELDVIGRPGFPGTSAPSGVPGFSLVSRSVARGLSVTRFRATPPVMVSISALRALDARVVTTVRWRGAPLARATPRRRR